MSQRSRHHYVPRFYLKRFASDRNEKEPKQIHLFNLASAKIIHHASIKGQCKKKKFYGEKPDLEDVLGKLEGIFSKVINKICVTETLPEMGTENHHGILLSTATQMLRTTKQEEIMNAQADNFAKMILSRDSRFNALNLESIKIGMKSPVIQALSQSGTIAGCLDDLGIHLLKSHSDSQFVTSDCPVFSYNLYRERFFSPGTTAPIARGIMIFYPLSPELCLLLYDTSVYKVGKRKKDFISSISSDEVKTVNLLQVIGAENNLYFSDILLERRLSNIVGTSSKLRNEIGPRTLEFQDIENPMRTVVINYYHVPNLHIKLSPISIKREWQRIPINKRLNLLRREGPNSSITPANTPRETTDGKKERVFKVSRDDFRKQAKF